MACFRASTLLIVMTGLGFAGAGCLAEDDTLGTTEQGIIQECSLKVCGLNGPLLSVGFHELYEGDGTNDQGMRLLGIYFSGVEWKVDVVGAELKARKGLLVKTGTALVGGVIWVKDAHSTLFKIRVDEVLTTNLYPVGSGTTTAYVLNWTTDAGPRNPVNICSDPESLLGEQDTLFQNKYSAVLFEGERYDADKLRIREGVPTANWFNIGCAGNVLAKSYLTHHTAASSSGSYTTTIPERNTIIKMLTADYCGTGHPFTVGGTPLSWTDDHGWLPHVYPLDVYGVKIEARWNDKGATCLETARLTGTTDPIAFDTFGDSVDTEIKTLIAAECQLPPPCSSVENDDVTKTEGKHLVSGNPHFSP